MTNIDPTPAVLAVERLSGTAPGTPAEVVEVRFRNDDLDALDQQSAVTLPQDVRTNLSRRVIATNVAQFIDVQDATFFQLNDFAIIDAGLDSQEVVQLTSVNDSNGFTALVQKNHEPGAAVYKCAAAQSKSFRIHVKTKPNNSIGKFRLQRQSSLPTGIYDQWRSPMTYVQGVTTPWISDSGVRYDRVPIIPVTFSAGVLNNVGYSSLVEIQWITTPLARNLAFPETVYRFLWDEA